MSQSQARELALQYAVAKCESANAGSIISMAMAFENYLLYGIMPRADTSDQCQPKEDNILQGDKWTPEQQAKLLAIKEGAAGQKLPRYIADTVLD